MIDSREPRDGKAIENIGFYNPSLPEPEFKIDRAKYDEWIGKGAQPSTAVVDLVAGNYTFKPYRREGEDQKQATKEETAENGQSEELPPEPSGEPETEEHKETTDAGVA